MFNTDFISDNNWSRKSSPICRLEFKFCNFEKCRLVAAESYKLFHYENMSMQYSAIIHVSKNENF